MKNYQISEEQLEIILSALDNHLFDESGEYNNSDIITAHSILTRIQAEQNRREVLERNFTL